MPINMNCPTCNKTLCAPDAAEGKKARCPACGAIMTVPERVLDAAPLDHSSDPREYSFSKDAFGSQQPSVSGQASGAGDGSTARRPCPICGEMIVATAIKCRFCGAMFNSGARIVSMQNQQGRIQPSTPPKDPVLMGLLSGCCIAGLGQMILGQVIKGVVILLGSMVLAVVTAGMSIFATWPLGGIDAYLVAKKLKEGNSVGEWEWF